MIRSCNVKRYKGNEGICVSPTVKDYRGRVYRSLYPDRNLLSLKRKNPDKFERVYTQTILNKHLPIKVYNDFTDFVILCDGSDDDYYSLREIISRWLYDRLGAKVKKI